MELKNRLEIEDRFRKVSRLIREDRKNLIAKYIATKLTVQRRTYLTMLSIDEVKQGLPGIERLTKFFADQEDAVRLKA